jgi:hypothetical protein
VRIFFFGKLCSMVELVVFLKMSDIDCLNPCTAFINTTFGATSSPR